MKLKDLIVLGEGLGPDALEYPLFLAAPDNVDGDSIDVQLSQIGDIQQDLEKGEIRFLPASVEATDISQDPHQTLDGLLRALPSGLLEEDNARLLVEIPLDRDKPGLVHRSLTDIYRVHVGTESQEVWMLLRPASEFPADALPA